MASATRCWTPSPPAGSTSCSPSWPPRCRTGRRPAHHRLGHHRLLARVPRLPAPVPQLLANAPPVLDAVTAVGPQLQDALDNTQTLVQVLATQRFAIDQFLQQGAGASQPAGQLGLLAGCQLGLPHHRPLAGVVQPGPAGQPDATVERPGRQPVLLRRWSPTCSSREQPRPSTSGEQDNPNQLFLRTRLLLPPKSPSADTYPTPQGLPATLPGQACANQLGTGVRRRPRPGNLSAAPFRTGAGIGWPASCRAGTVVIGKDARRPE